jgi:cell division protein ZapA (FtsZ GTPase activity inhibitor)
MWIRYITLFYLVFQSIVIALNELGILQFLSDSTILRVWITRGLLYAYIGVLCLQQTQIIFTGRAADDKVHGASLKTYLEVISYMMISWGLLYALMWMLCLQRLDRSLRQEAKDSAEQERKEEIERRGERREKGEKKSERKTEISGEGWAV